ncbi:hypothetical protein M231_02991 [Tremella mesenterica]|uniref:NodB homology domain-containing protein n=1 Tax=Tremella mesenterica TaxID=5217 RepID=A0A4Q1BPG2_TREME|nr:uncharacterized protein TREMEDRAFT_35412 [Tremella mesenterica DSM 1558]EIW66227.1 hypothetical protein TREMEDRAFT_35412 [Tremella mesenterica DSM 1558]RXK39798.1 hypothetical protein M231_02991 [Tremella mesenterica]
MVAWNQETFYVPPRDFVGYGLEPPTDCWPDGKKIAVSFVLNYEEGAESTPWNGDKISCATLHELSYDRPAVEGRDCMSENFFEYGIRQGLPRLLKLFKEFGWHWTTWVCARAFETSGPYPKMLVADGHEIACHGNRWGIHGSNTAEEKAHINKSFDRLQEATGLKNVPTGWFIGGGSVRQKLVRAEVHKERGVPLVYNSDSFGSDLPYYIPDPYSKIHGGKDEGMLMIPYSLCTNDHRFYVSGGAGVSAPDDWFELMKGEFDQLYSEGVAGHPKMMTVAMHNRMVAKPGRSMALRKFMQYISTKPDVWVCTRSEIAKVWREKYPYEKVGPTYDLHH